MKKAIFFLIVIAGISKLSVCQQHGQEKIDSLFRYLITAKEDTSKVKTLNSLAYELASNNPDTSVYFASQALTIAKKINYQLGIASAYYNIGEGLEYLQKSKEALKNYNNALELFEALLTSETTVPKSQILRGKAKVYNGIGLANDDLGNGTVAIKSFSVALKIYQELVDKLGMAKIYNNIGSIYYEQDNYPEALKYFFSALKLNGELGNKQEVASNLTNIGLIHQNQGNYAEALKNVLSALSINKEIGNKRQIAGNLSNLGYIYSDLGNYDEALKKYSLALKLNEEVDNNQWKAININNIGVIYERQGNFAEALTYYFDALKIVEEIGDKGQAATCYINIGNIYIKLKQYNKASMYLKKGLAAGKELGSIKEIQYGYRGLADLDSAQGNFKRSMENYKMYYIYRDSLINLKNTKKTMQIQMQYEFDKKESALKAEQEKKDAIALKELQKQKLLKFSFLGVIGLVLILFFFIYRTYRARQELRLYDIRNRIAGDLHDDIGSTLNSISIYSEVAKKNDEHHDEALEMIGEASRKIIEAMSDIVWTINADNDSFQKIIFRMKSLAYNLFRAKKIEYTFHADEILNEKKLSLEERRNFYLIFKEAVNNLVKYANATCVAITLTNENNQIRLRIQDDGAGFDISHENAGNGLKNMKRRAEEMKAEFKLESKLGEGTRIELTLRG